MAPSTVVEPGQESTHTNTLQSGSSRHQMKGMRDFFFLNFCEDYSESAAIGADSEPAFVITQEPGEISQRGVVSVVHPTRPIHESTVLPSDLESRRCFILGDVGRGKTHLVYAHVSNLHFGEQHRLANGEDSLGTYDDPDYREDGFTMDWKLAAELYFEFEKIRTKQLKEAAKESEQNDSRSF